MAERHRSSVAGLSGGSSSTLRRAGSRVRASWERSRSYGVSVEHVEPVFTGAVDIDSLLYECGLQVLQGLHQTLANEPVSLMIADSEGLVLTRLCNDSAINRSLDRVHLARGFYFTERNAGTNGLGLALADRVPTLVRADQHYCRDLQGYTCAAVPVLDPVSGDLAGTVNLTTWADSSADLLLALAQSAASNTSALMLLRSTGRRAKPTPRGQVTRVLTDRAITADPCASPAWTGAVDQAGRALDGSQVLAVTGESGSGKSTLLSTALRRTAGRERILHVRPPAGESIEGWLDLWSPELGHAETCVLISDAQTLPAWIAGQLAARLTGPVRARYAFTTTDFAAVPDELKALVDTVVETPPLRRRTEDIMPLAQYFARQERHREVVFTPMAARSLTTFNWPENIRQLDRVVRHAVARTDIVDSQHLPTEVFSGSGRALSRLDNLKRDEIIRCLTEPGATVAGAAEELGMSRATIYRKISQYEIRLPGRTV